MHDSALQPYKAVPKNARRVYIKSMLSILETVRKEASVTLFLNEPVYCVVLQHGYLINSRHAAQVNAQIHSRLPQCLVTGTKSASF